MRYEIIVLAFALAGAGVVWSCSLLQQVTTGDGGSIELIAIPTSSAGPDADEIVLAELHDDGSCLHVITIEGNGQGPSILPISPRWSCTAGTSRARQPIR